MCEECSYPAELAQQEPDDDDGMCDSCTCCSRYGCYGGPDSGCPTNSEGDFVCPCTCD